MDTRALPNLTRKVRLVQSLTRLSLPPPFPLTSLYDSSPFPFATIALQTFPLSLFLCLSPCRLFTYTNTL